MKLKDTKKLQKEKIEFDKIVSCLEEFKSFYVNAGAGSGKTYTLIQLIKYLIYNKKIKLRTNSQKILCITYTNVAADEIKEKIRFKEFMYVSTIHDFIWTVIKRYKNKVKEVHVEYVKEKISEYYKSISDNDEFKRIPNEKKQHFINFFKEEVLKEYYKIYSSKKEAWVNFLNNMVVDKVGINQYQNDRTFNLGKMKSLLKDIVAMNKLRDYIKNADNIIIKYDQQRNTDQLHKGKFSHDTLLIYFNKIIKNNEILKLKIANKYPYIFIDEYQDTSKLVIDSFIEIKNYSLSKDIRFMIGLLGDPSQNIYDKGIGNIQDISNHDAIKTKFEDFEDIDKEYNRRSKDEIIYLSNKFRWDKSKKESIYSGFNGAKIIFEQDNVSIYDREKYNHLIEKVYKKLGLNSEERLDVLVTRNEFVTHIYNFNGLYNILRRFPCYSGANFNEFNSKFFNKEKFKDDLEMIFNVVSLYNAFVNGDKISNLITKRKFNKYSITIEDIIKMREYISYKIDINDITINDWLSQMYSIYKELLEDSVDLNWKQVLLEIFKSKLVQENEDIFKFNFYSTVSNKYLNNKIYNDINDFQNRINSEYKDNIESHVKEVVNGSEDLLRSVYSVIDNIEDKDKLVEYIIKELDGEENLDIINKLVDGLLEDFYNLKISEIMNWFNYLNDKKTTEMQRIHTIHGTKGTTLQNVLIILNKGFKSNSTEYEMILNKLLDNNNFSNYSKKEKKALNLMYVAISRAVNNIYILYNDSFSRCEELKNFIEKSRVWKES
jgi:DNA helicase-2/ATP-dependent DNA helicase PcrA